MPNGVQDVQAGNETHKEEPYEVIDGTAIIDLMGCITKYPQVPCCGSSTLEVAKNIQQSLDDVTVDRVLIYIESGGGEVSGIYELAQLIASAKQIKPVWVYAVDLLASAAYWVASQADRIVCSELCFVGSIGVYEIITDNSAAFEAEGIKNIVVKAGDYKGMGEDGVTVTDEQLAEFQRNIDDIYDIFVNHVATGRGMSIESAYALADGKSWIATDAIELGLIDEIQPVETILQYFTSQTGIQ